MSLNRTKFLEPNEDKEILSLPLTTRNNVIVVLARETGARASEILNIRPCDLFPDNVVLIRGLKKSNDREIPIRPELMAALRKYIPFGIQYSRLDQIWDRYKPNGKKFHSLRHTFAVSLYKRTRDIKLVQLALGHRSPTNTAVYTNFVYTTEEMKRILD